MQDSVDSGVLRLTKNHMFLYAQIIRFLQHAYAAQEKKLNARENIEPNIYLKIIILLHLYT